MHHKAGTWLMNFLVKELEDKWVLRREYTCISALVAYRGPLE